MSTSRVLRRLLPIGVITAFAGLFAVHASEPDPKVMSYLLPDQIKWSTGPGAKNAVLYGEPSKPGFYVMLHRWTPHTNSRPHLHQYDRFIYVVKGTWWVGWGPKYDFNSTYPMPEGSFVRHFGKEIHYDGAKDEECTLLIAGEGPETATRAEEK